MKGRKKQQVRFKPAGTHDKFNAGWSFMQGPDLTHISDHSVIEWNAIHQWCSENLDSGDWCSGEYAAKMPKKDSPKWWDSRNGLYGGFPLGSIIVWYSNRFTTDSTKSMFYKKTWFMFRTESDMVQCRLAYR